MPVFRSSKPWVFIHRFQFWLYKTQEKHQIDDPVACYRGGIPENQTVSLMAETCRRCVFQAADITAAPYPRASQADALF